jgi:DNA-binding MarR family transcriptional regulator
MAVMKHTRRGALFTELVLEIFRINGRLLSAGDDMTRDLGLSSARWQVLGAIELAGEPLTVAGIARQMGLTRQAVQRVANELAADGFVAFRPNPSHKRAKLVALTERGQRDYAQVAERQACWANDLAAELGKGKLKRSAAMLRAMRKMLEANRNHLARDGKDGDEQSDPDQPV